MATVPGRALARQGLKEGGKAAAKSLLRQQAAKAEVSSEKEKKSAGSPTTYEDEMAIIAASTFEAVAVHDEGVRADSLKEAFLEVVLVVNLAEDLFEDILHGN